MNNSDFYSIFDYMMLLHEFAFDELEKLYSYVYDDDALCRNYEKGYTPQDLRNDFESTLNTIDCPDRLKLISYLESLYEMH